MRSAAGRPPLALNRSPHAAHNCFPRHPKVNLRQRHPSRCRAHIEPQEHAERSPAAVPDQAWDGVHVRTSDRLQRAHRRLEHRKRIRHADPPPQQCIRRRPSPRGTSHGITSGSAPIGSGRVRTETAGPAFAAFHGLESSLAASSGPACASKGHRDSRPARCFAGCRHRGTVALISAPSTSQVLR
jgi:hypothetical protein